MSSAWTNGDVAIAQPGRRGKSQHNYGNLRVAMREGRLLLLWPVIGSGIGWSLERDDSVSTRLGKTQAGVSLLWPLNKKCPIG